MVNIDFTLGWGGRGLVGSRSALKLNRSWLEKFFETVEYHEGSKSVTTVQ